MTGPLQEQLLVELQRGPAIVADLCAAVGHTPPLVEAALRLLARRGVVVAEVEGRPPVRRWRLAAARGAAIRAIEVES